MTPDEERWAEALAIERLHGRNALAWVAKRALALADAGDQAGVDRMREIWTRLMQLAVDRRQQ